jgi:hypothetical protein
LVLGVLSVGAFAASDSIGTAARGAETAGLGNSELCGFVALRMNAVYASHTALNRTSTVETSGIS